MSRASPKPSQLEALYIHIIRTLTELLEAQNRTQKFDRGLIVTAIREIEKLGSNLPASLKGGNALEAIATLRDGGR